MIDARAVLLEELVGLRDVLRLDQPAVRSLEDRRSGLRTDPVADEVAGHRRDRRRRRRRPQRRGDGAGGDEQPGHERRRVARQEEPISRPALDEQDHQDGDDGPRAEAVEDRRGLQPLGPERGDCRARARRGGTPVQANRARAVPPNRLAHAVLSAACRSSPRSASGRTRGPGRTTPGSTLSCSRAATGATSSTATGTGAIDAIVADLDTRRHDFHVAIETGAHDLNIGTVVRTANACLAAAVHIVGNAGGTGAGRWSPTATSTCATTTRRGLPRGRTSGCPRRIDNLPGAVPLETSDLPRRCVLVFGQEGPGLSEPARAACDGRVLDRAVRLDPSINAGAARPSRCTPGCAGTPSTSAPYPRVKTSPSRWSDSEPNPVPFHRQGRAAPGSDRGAARPAAPVMSGVLVAERVVVVGGDAAGIRAASQAQAPTWTAATSRSWRSTGRVGVLLGVRDPLLGGGRRRRSGGLIAHA